MVIDVSSADTLLHQAGRHADIAGTPISYVVPDSTHAQYACWYVAVLWKSSIHTCSSVSSVLALARVWEESSLISHASCCCSSSRKGRHTDIAGTPISHEARLAVLASNTLAGTSMYVRANQTFVSFYCAGDGVLFYDMTLICNFSSQGRHTDIAGTPISHVVPHSALEQNACWYVARGRILCASNASHSL